MRGKRFFWFLVMIGLGLGLGLLYGWFISPLKVQNTSPETLRADYRADYVLMVAEIYDADRDLEQAARRLKFLGDRPSGQIAAEGVTTAQELGYSQADLDLMNFLVLALQDQPATPTPGGQP